MVATKISSVICVERHILILTREHDVNFQFPECSKVGDHYEIGSRKYTHCIAAFYDGTTGHAGVRIVHRQ